MGAFKLDYGDYFYCTKKCSKSNHLGNVLTLFTDKKIPALDANKKIYYKADLVSSMDYSPFGAPLKGRTFNGSGSRYGFNGKEKTDEVSGGGNNYDYGFRIYNPRLGKFLSVDPLTRKFAFYTPYQFAGNKPIFAFDLDGLEDIAYLYRMVGNSKTLVQTIDYTKTDAGTGPLGHGTYVQIVNKKGDKFSEAFVTRDGNSIPSFSEGGINRANFKDIKVRLDSRLIEKTVENVLKSKGFDSKTVEADVQVLDIPDFAGKFATFKEGTAEKYTTGWNSAKPSDAHQSNTAKQSSEIGNSDVLIKNYDGAKSATDNIPNQIGLVREGIVDHCIEAVRSLASPNVNIGAENATRVKNDAEKK